MPFPVQSIQPRTGGWIVSAGSKSDHFDAVILAVPARAAAATSRALVARTLRRTRRHRYSSSITVGLGYDRNVRDPFRLASDFWCRAAKANACLPPLLFTTNFPIALPKSRSVALLLRRIECGKCLAAFRRSNRRPRTQRTATNSWPSRRRRSLPVSIDGNPRWRNMASDTSNDLDRIERLRQQLPGLALPATATAESAFPIASARAECREGTFDKANRCSLSPRNSGGNSALLDPCLPPHCRHHQPNLVIGDFAAATHPSLASVFDLARPSRLQAASITAAFLSITPCRLKFDLPVLRADWRR